MTQKQKIYGPLPLKKTIEFKPKYPKFGWLENWIPWKIQKERQEKYNVAHGLPKNKVYNMFEFWTEEQKKDRRAYRRSAKKYNKQRSRVYRAERGMPFW